MHFPHGPARGSMYGSFFFFSCNTKIEGRALTRCESSTDRRLQFSQSYRGAGDIHGSRYVSPREFAEPRAAHTCCDPHYSLLDPRILVTAASVAVSPLIADMHCIKSYALYMCIIYEKLDVQLNDCYRKPILSFFSRVPFSYPHHSYALCLSGILSTSISLMINLAVALSNIYNIVHIKRSFVVRGDRNLGRRDSPIERIINA